MTKKTYGIDPEFFVKSGKDFVVSCGKFGGTKEKPIKQPFFNNYGNSFNNSGNSFYLLHEDNVTLELGFAPATNVAILMQHLSAGISSINLTHMHDKPPLVIEENTWYTNRHSQHNFRKKVIAKWIRSDSVVSEKRPVDYHTFKDSQLTSKQAKVFGCDPDMCAYDGPGAKRPPPPIDFGNTRFAGGHIHLGGEFNCPPFVSALFADVFIGLPLCRIGMLTTKERGIWYGKPGIYREKPYGIEYRTPGNMWALDGACRNYVGTLMHSLSDYLVDTSAEQIRDDLNVVDWNKVREILTELDVYAADTYIKELEDKIPHVKTIHRKDQPMLGARLEHPDGIMDDLMRAQPWVGGRRGRARQ